MANSTLTALFTEVTGLEYETFQNTVESLTTTDRNTEDLVFVMRLGWNVVGRLGSARSKAFNFFRRYIGSNYIGEMAQAGGAVRFMDLIEYCEHPTPPLPRLGRVHPLCPPPR